MKIAKVAFVRNAGSAEREQFRKNVLSRYERKGLVLVPAKRATMPPMDLFIPALDRLSNGDKSYQIAFVYRYLVGAVGIEN